MVEKIDKPEPPPTYYVQPTVETKRDRGGQGGPQQQSDEYSGSHAAPGWQKIYAAASNRRYLKLRREEIVRAWLRGTIMQKGISLAEVDVEIKDGRILKGAHVILSTREDFWTLKKFQPGQEVPLNMLIKEPVLEISLPAQRPNVMQPASGTQKGEEKKTDIKALLIYGAIGAVVLFLIIFALTR